MTTDSRKILGHNTRAPIRTSTPYPVRGYNPILGVRIRTLGKSLDKALTIIAKHNQTKPRRSRANSVRNDDSSPSPCGDSEDNPVFEGY